MHARNAPATRDLSAWRRWSWQAADQRRWHSDQNVARDWSRLASTLEKRDRQSFAGQRGWSWILPLSMRRNDDKMPDGSVLHEPARG